MFFSKKKLVSCSSMLFALIVLMLFGTICFKYSLYASNYYTGYEIASIDNLTIKSLVATLLTSVCVALVFNFISLFVEKMDENKIAIVNTVLWVIALAFSITLLFSQYISASYTTTNSFIFVLLSSVVAIIANLYFWLKQPLDD